MTDLIERLRTYDPDVDSPDVVSEAADEIERLRVVRDLFRTPEEIIKQRAKGWTDWHPEDYCHKCGQRNIKSWYADSALWNKAAPIHVIWCPQCLVEAYETATGERPIWRLAPAELSDERSALIQSEAAMRHERDHLLTEWRIYIASINTAGSRDAGTEPPRPVSS